jgi:hypothetical protein
MKSPTAQHLPRLENPRDMRWSNGWYLSHMPPIDTAATIGRNELKAGKTPDCLEFPVAQYALANDVYRSAAARKGWGL